MKVQFKALTSSSSSLFPGDIFDMIPNNHPVRSVNQVVDNLDLDAVIKLYKGGAQQAIIPECLSRFCSTHI